MQRQNRWSSECALWAGNLCGRFLRYACAQNPHLRLVNCGFSRFASLELATHKSPAEWWWVTQNPLAGNAGNACNPCNPCDPCDHWFFPRVPRITGVTGKIGEFFERWLFSGRGEALRRRVAGEMVAHSNLFESGLAVRLLHYLRKIATPPRKGVRVTLLLWWY